MEIKRFTQTPCLPNTAQQKTLKTSLVSSRCLSIVQEQLGGKRGELALLAGSLAHPLVQWSSPALVHCLLCSFHLQLMFSTSGT
jgi:hypothetical protein